MKLPHIALLVCAGLIAGALRPGALTDIFRQVALFGLLPALIFEAAWNVDLELARKAWKPIALLSVPGVAITALLVALGTHAFGGLALPAALLLGAILSATDPVAVVALFRRLNVPPALATIVESESLLNDAVAVVVYRAVLASVLAGSSIGALGTLAFQALAGSACGLALGVAVGIGCAQAVRLRDAPLQTVSTFVAAYGAYYIAERLGWSGIFALIASGVAFRECDRRLHGADLAASVERVWSIAAIVANAVLFFLIGAAVEPLHVFLQWRLLAATLGAVLAARLVLAYGLLAIVPEMPPSWKAVVRLAGVRGALALALALALPRAAVGRDLVTDATFAVVILTTVAGALTVERRVARLDLD